ncbi:chaoptin-like [Sitodiplosis mosellana]|uniref:chaoptin-like n=1 Tax=Sitodiplosis mosellana TaxID=263140 RepID=UPI002444831C|nr:chaoptin-like [Sitodiplosis mosellana]
MSSHFIYMIFVILAVLHGVSSEKYQYIGNCRCDKSASPGKWALKFICIENYAEKNYFSSGWSVCGDQNGFYKWYIGSINFKNCKFKQIPNNTFEVYYDVYDLNLSNLGIETLRPENFAGATNLKNLNASDNKLTEVSANLFHDAVNLVKLEISYNQIAFIAPEAFSTADHLTLLTLNENKISELSVELFQKFRALKNLYLSSNRISVVPADLFSKCTNLKYLDCSKNQINFFDSNAFSDGNHLETLLLSFNNISDLPVDTFQKLVELKTLDLSFNNIVEIPSFLFHKMEKLIEVNFSHNKISRIDFFAFLGVPNLEKVILANNELKSLDRQIFDAHSSIKHVDVSFNQIAALKVDALYFLENLSYFNISNNAIKTVNNKTFAKNVYLETLSLSNCDLSEIKAGTFSPVLKSLDLSRNQLKTLDVQIAMVQPEQLVYLSIVKNQLRELNGFTASNINENLKIAGIDSNNFNCSYFQKLFETITPLHFDTIKNRIHCNSDNEETVQDNSRESTTTPSKEVILNPTETTTVPSVETTANQFEATAAPSFIQTVEIATTSENAELNQKHVESTKIEITTTGEVIRLHDPEAAENTQAKMKEAEALEFNFTKLTESEKLRNSIDNNLTALHNDKYLSKYVENNTNREHQITVNKMHHSLISLEKYLFVMTCLMALGFTLIVMAVAWKIFHSRFIKQTEATQVIYRRDEVIIPNGVVNNNYEVIKFDKEQPPVQAFKPHHGAD